MLKPLVPNFRPDLSVRLNGSAREAETEGTVDTSYLFKKVAYAYNTKAYD